MPIDDPTHPGEIVKWECLEPLGLTVTRAAQGLGVTRQALSDLVNESSGSVRRDGPTACPRRSAPRPRLQWLRMQMAYDLWQSRDRASEIKVERFADAQPQLSRAVLFADNVGDNPKVVR